MSSKRLNQPPHRLNFVKTCLKRLLAVVFLLIFASTFVYGEFYTSDLPNGTVYIGMKKLANAETSKLSGESRVTIVHCEYLEKSLLPDIRKKNRTNISEKNPYNSTAYNAGHQLENVRSRVQEQAIRVDHDAEPICFISKYGSAYHSRPDCSVSNGRMHIPVYDLSDLPQHLEPCSNCWKTNKL